QDEGALVAAREEPVERRDAQVAQVEAPGRAGREAGADRPCPAHEPSQVSTRAASPWLKPGTRAISSGDASLSPFTEPKRARSACCRRGPMPGMDERS